MSRIIEPIFNIAYLVTIISLGLLMIIKSNNSKQRKLFGILALILGCGDAFHLIPRIFSLITDSMEANVALLGFGKLITSITMTVFYILVYHFWCGRYKKPIKSVITIIIYGLSLCRIALCLFPQNDWLSENASYVWGIYRNIPFMILGVLIVILFYSETRRVKDKSFKYAWLAVFLSFAFYIPVILWADSFPVIGMMMIPKTVCYVWFVVMGFRDNKTS